MEPAVFAAVVQERTARISRESACLRATARDLIRASYARMRRRHAIAGSSGGDPVRERVANALATGTLPPVDGRAWAGKAAGVNRCACCGEPIGREQHEYEPQGHPGLHAHARCYTVWLAESVVRRPRERAS